MTESSIHTGLVVEIETLLRQISKEVRRRGREILSEFSITPPQFDALIYLNEFGDLTIGELSSKLYLAYSTTTDLVDRMERNDLVERVRDKNDRRVVRLHMKERGRDMIQQVLVVRREHLAKALVHVESKDLAPLVTALSEIYNHISD
ncbi:MarR family winged helix-turn-helix transcriptional regulator [Tumebacillus permanentifrigoris]|uniref:DNA-binding MarR family transcriptional regulator n=1 Tax=Tumebacillus permanentifrigoris TaxID=378543 RepID=A0A316DCX5_9BACL|nr:MarR family transcriptional regulator [Tumebacillus permanentifrigoris]PWK15844.1 DNA-binding MarR family transcriptional regulator [Tumebacillus permanentifrigoris]